MKQETKRRIEISNLHEFADSLILIDNRIERCKKHQASTIVLIAISKLPEAAIHTGQVLRSTVHGATPPIQSNIYGIIKGHYHAVMFL